MLFGGVVVAAVGRYVLLENVVLRTLGQVKNSSLWGWLLTSGRPRKAYHLAAR